MKISWECPMRRYFCNYCLFAHLKVFQTFVLHCIKSVRIWSFSGSYFPASGPNTERYEVSLHIQSKCEKMRTRKTPNTDTFQAVIAPLKKVSKLNLSQMWCFKSND